jgi:hypothetical protein
MRSAKAARGPLSHMEGTIAQFYKYLARTLAADRAHAAKAMRQKERRVSRMISPAKQRHQGWT